MANIITETFDKVKEKFIPSSFEKKEIKITDSDSVLIPKLNIRIEDARGVQRPKRLEWNKNLRFFDGDHWTVAGIQLPRYKADIFINKVFAAFRSLVAYETDAKPEPVVNARITPGVEPEKAEALTAVSKKIESMLDYKWDARQVPITLTEIYYDRYIFNDGYGMYFWNAVIDDVDFELIKPQELLRSPGSTSVEDAEYIVVEKWRNRKYFEENYPDLVDKIQFTNAKDIEPGELLSESSNRDNLAKVDYYFQDDIWVFKCENVILEKKQNPYWEWRTGNEQREQILDRFGGIVPEGWKPVRNHLKRPEKPIVHFKGYHLGGEFESRSLMKQIMKLNEAVNKRKCQIQDILDATGSPQIVVDPSVSRDDAEKITSKPGLKIRINPALIKVIPPSPPPLFTLEDLIHTERKFDDVVGLHEVSVGATPKKRITKGEVEMLKESDITPIRLLMRNSESAIIKLINGWVQLMKLFYDQPHYIGHLGMAAVETYGEFLVREEIPDDLSILIKVGSTMPVSREMRRAQYIRDFQMGAISLLDYLKMMDYPNPERLAQNVQQQMAGQVAGTPTGTPAGKPSVPPTA